MKQHIEMVVKVRNVKEIHTRNGKFMYSFSIPLVKMAGEEQLTEWVQVAILQETQRKDVMSAKEVHFIGSLVVKEAYGKYPQGISIFGFFIDPILSNVYRQSKVKKNVSEDAPQAPTANSNVPTQAQSGYTDPVSAMNPQNEYIPM